MDRQISDFKIHIIRHGEGGPCIFVSKSDREENGAEQLAKCVARKAKNVVYTLVVFEVTDRNAQLSPWSAPMAFGDDKS